MTRTETKQDKFSRLRVGSVLHGVGHERATVTSKDGMSGRVTLMFQDGRSYRLTRRQLEVSRWRLAVAT